MVSVFIDQPFTSLASVATFHFISSCAPFGARSRAFFTAGSTLSKSERLSRPVARCLIFSKNWSFLVCGGLHLPCFFSVGEGFTAREGIDPALWASVPY